MYLDFYNKYINWGDNKIQKLADILYILKNKRSNRDFYFISEFFQKKKPNFKNRFSKNNTI